MLLASALSQELPDAAAKNQVQLLDSKTTAERRAGSKKRTKTETAGLASYDSLGMSDTESRESLKAAL